MQKQRSPYTGGGFNVKQMKAANFCRDSRGLNGMPFLMQFAEKAQQPPVNSGQQRMGRPPLQRIPDATPLGQDRGQRGSPRSFRSDCNFNGHYEGDIPTLPLGCNPGLEKNEDCDMPQLGGMRRLGTKRYPNDNNSEIEYFQQLNNNCDNGESRWRRSFDYVKSGMPPQRQQQLEAAVQRVCQNVVAVHVLLLLQLISVAVCVLLKRSVRLGIYVTQLGFRLWRCKYQLRSILRQMAWRMANAKGHDALLFLGVMLLTPWLFLISLLGFAIAFVFFLKEGLGTALHQVHLQLI